MVFDIEGLGIKCQAIFSCDFKKYTIVLIRDIHVLFIRAKGKARCLIRQYRAFEDSKKPAKLIATTNNRKGQR